MLTVKKTKLGAVSCLACRNKHVKCDGERPICLRCRNTHTQCIFVPSRRGINMLGHSRQTQKAPSALSPAYEDTIEVDIVSNNKSTVGQPDSFPRASDADGHYWPLILPTSPTNKSGPRPAADALVLLYYQHVHPIHPFLLPRDMYISDPGVLPEHVKAAVRFIAKMFEEDQSAIWQEAGPILHPDVPEDGFKVQALMVTALALFARADRDNGNETLRHAIELASRLGNSLGALRDPTCETRKESWRRTCAELQSISTLGNLFIGTRTKFEFPPEMDVPSSYTNYRTCRVTAQMTFAKMQDRILWEDGTNWSSTAYGIEAVRILKTVVDIDPCETDVSTVNSIDASITSFLLSLPKEVRQYADMTDMDEEMFSALMIIHFAAISLHLPRSDLVQTRIVETDCKTARVGTATTTPRAHRVAALRAANDISRMLTSRGTTRTLSPCFACGIAMCFAVQLPAYLQEQNHASRTMLKEYLQLSLVVLGVMGETWPVALMVRSQISQVAKEVLARFDQTGLQPPSAVPVQKGLDPLLLTDEQWLHNMIDFPADFTASDFATDVISL